MTRHAATASLAWGLAAVAACSQPPRALFEEPPGDARPADAQTRDARVDGPRADARAADAGGIDAAADAAVGNPSGIVFTEVTAEVGDFPGGRVDPDPWGLGSGAAIGDADGDGDLDLFLARCDSPAGGPSVLLRRTSALSFTSDPAMATAFAGTCARAAVFGDYDRDGDVDLFVAMNGPDRLYRNNGDGVFVDVTDAAGVAGPADDLNTSAYLVDVNHDGLLDLLVLAHITVWPPAPDPRVANRLYLNRGDGTFREESVAAGVAGNGSSQAAAIADLDRDGDLDIYVANDRYAVDGANAVDWLDADQWLELVSYDSEGVPSYTDRSAGYGTDGPRSSMGVTLADIDGDGREDIFVSDWGANHMQVWSPALGAYEDQAAARGLAQARNDENYLLVSWGAEFTDLDRDGTRELIVINGSIFEPLSCASWSQLDFVLQRQGGVFLDITAEVGWPRAIECPPVADTPISGRGLVLADLDGDSDDDLLITPFIERYRVYRNDTPARDRHWLRIEPRGTVSAPSPYGAVLEVSRADGATVRRVLHAGGTYSQRLPVLEAGLGASPTVRQATLTWPSGYVQRLDLTPGFAMDTTWAVIEPAWLSVSARVAAADGPVPVLVYRPVDERGAFIGPAASGRRVTVSRSDGAPVTVVDQGDGSYTAALPHPGQRRVTVVRVTDGDTTLRPRLTVSYQ